MQSSHTFRANLAKFTESQNLEAKSFNQGVKVAFANVLTSGDDDHWTELNLREDGNGNRCWYVDLHSCPPERGFPLDLSSNVQSSMLIRFDH